MTILPINDYRCIITLKNGFAEPYTEKDTHRSPTHFLASGQNDTKFLSYLS